MLKRMLLVLALAGFVLAPGTRCLAAEGHADASTVVEHAAAGHGVEGEHPKDVTPDPSDAQTWYGAFWVLLIFILLLVILYRTAWKQVLAGLKAREQRIRNDIAEAEAARTKAEATLREYNARLAAAEERARETINRAAADAEQIAGQIRTRAQQEAEEIRDRALRDIETARAQALTDIYEQAASLATSVAEKILRRNLNPDDQRDLVRQSLEQVQTIGRG